MASKRKPTRPTPAAPEAQFLSDPEGAFELGVGLSKFFELQQRDPDFPAPVWHGPRSKRHVRSELQAYALRKRAKVAA